MRPSKFEEIDDDELERIQCVVDAASPGPWLSYVVGRDPHTQSNYIELGSCNELGSCSSLELAGSTAGDLDFIASARQDLPRLLREVHALRARLHGLLKDEHCATASPARGLLDGTAALHGNPM